MYELDAGNGRDSQANALQAVTYIQICSRAHSPSLVVSYGHKLQSKMQQKNFELSLNLSIVIR